MRMDICTLPRLRTLSKPMFTVVALLLLAPFAAAENGQRDTRSAQAELHISVIVAPVVFPPRHKDHDGDRDRDESAVIYNLPSSTEKTSISQEMKTMLVDHGKQAQVELTTVVVK